MDMQPVKSSNIEAIGHDPASATLRVKFHSGHTYDYPNVTAAEHREFLAASSPGSHFHRTFRSRPFDRVS
jgi:KTSC domain